MKSSACRGGHLELEGATGGNAVPAFECAHPGNPQPIAHFCALGVLGAPRAMKPDPKVRCYIWVLTRVGSLLDADRLKSSGLVLVFFLNFLPFTGQKTTATTTRAWRPRAELDLECVVF